MMKDHEISSDKITPTVNALLIIDVQEKIIRPIFNKDSIIQNVKKLLNAYQILEENIFVSEQNPLKLGGLYLNYYPKLDLEKLKKWNLA